MEENRFDFIKKAVCRPTRGLLLLERPSLLVRKEEPKKKVNRAGHHEQHNSPERAGRKETPADILSCPLLRHLNSLYVITDYLQERNT